MASTTTLRAPYEHPLINPQTQRLTEPWQLYFQRLTTANNGNAPVGAQYIVAAADAVLTAERVATNTATVTWDFATVGQAQASVPDDAITFAKMQEIATQRVIGRNTAGTGNPEEVTASQVLDWIGSTRGAVVYRGAAGWAVLAPGTSGYALVSNGAGADPSYQAVTADIQALLDSISTTQGAILYRNASDWVALSPGTDGQVLQTQGAGANPQWQDVNQLGYWSPLTNGDPVSPELIFDGNGDTVSVWTAL